MQSLASPVRGPDAVGLLLLVLNNLAPFYCRSRRKLAIFGGSHASSLGCPATF